MTDERLCPRCHAAMSPNAPHGLCPRCLMDAGLRPLAEDKIEGPGSEIGRYELLSLIGEGGMGLVYLAEQKEPIRRKVALKIVKLGMDTMQVVARFRAEQQTLAMLDHPNIAQVFDAGTTESGRPYFVMEYVEGVPITKYCDRQKLSIDERLRLFVQVCAAIQHAHQKGVLHRDIKPSNILVSANDHAPLPKIIDFGIAKAVHQPLTEQTSITEQGQLLGTPEYMSPEQADMAYSQVDTRSDVYSLGVVLYELLAGAPPFEGETLRKRGVEHIRQTIRDEEPKTPSARLTALGEQAKEVAAMRRTQIIALARRLKSELEWIPLKAMRKEREERYQSVSELAQDISNYLKGEALLAGPQSRLYRTRKFVRKHAGSVTTVALVGIALILGLLASTAMAYKAEQARRQEAKARGQAENARAIAEEQSEEYRRLLYAHRIALADASYQDGSVKRVRELLEACPEDLRGWEWDRLDYIASDVSLKTMRGHTAEVVGITVSRDGKCIASGSVDGTVKIWNLDSGAELITLKGHEGGAGPVSFSPDGERIASGGRDKTVRVWDVKTGAELMQLQGHEGAVRSVAFCPDGTQLASADMASPGVVKIWNAQTGDSLMTLRGHKASALGLAFSPDGSRIVSSDRYGLIKVWNTETGIDEMTLQGHIGPVFCVAFSPDGTRIASSGYDRKIKIWDARKGSELMTLQGHTFFVLSIAFSPDGRRLVSAGRAKLKIWDTQTGEDVMVLYGHTGGIYSVAFSTDGNSIISGSGDKSVKVWDAIVNRERMILGDDHVGVYPLAFSPDGAFIATGGGPNGQFIRVWDAARGVQLRTLDGHGGKYIISVSIGPDGRRIISGGNDNTVRVWDVKTGDEVMALDGHTDAVTAASFSGDGERIVSASFDGTIKIWSAADGTELKTLKGHDGGVRSVVFSPDGRKIASGGRDHTVRLWEARSGEQKMILRGHGERVQAVAFSPDGQRLVSAGGDQTVRVWDANTGDMLNTLEGHERMVYAVAFSPDGERIVSGGHFGVIKMWNAATGAEVMTLRHGGFGIGFSPDGRIMAATTGTGITLWESQAPRDGYKARRTGIRAERVVESMHDDLGLYSEVGERLRDNQTLDESVRELALQIAQARLWQDELAEDPASFVGGD